MISLWLPLWSLIGPDEGLIFLIIVFTFFITISIIVKFRSQSNMSCTANRHYFVAQECMSLTKNPFQFRLTPKKQQNENQSTDEVDQEKSNKTTEQPIKTNNDENDSDKKETKQSINKEVNEVEINKEASPSNQTKSDCDNDFKKGIKIDVFCKENFYLCYYWGVNIDQFHNFMRLNTQSFNDRIFDGTLFEQAYLEKNEPELVIGSNQVKTFHLTCSDKVNPDTLGQSPRTCYPLVVILARDLSKEVQDPSPNKDGPNNNGQNNANNINDVIFMINVIHVKDKICPLDTNVITRLLKKRNGMTINLQTLYTPSEFEDETGSNNTALCVICQETSVSIALLPCKHACTCLECFSKIDKCPLCRSYIRSYFVLKFDENNQQQQQQQQETNQSQHQSSSSNQTNEAQQPQQQQSNQTTRQGFLRRVKNLFRT